MTCAPGTRPRRRTSSSASCSGRLVTMNCPRSVSTAQTASSKVGSLFVVSNVDRLCFIPSPFLFRDYQFRYFVYFPDSVVFFRLSHQFCPNGFGGGGSSRDFPGSIFCGGGGSSRNFPGPIFCGVPEFFHLSPVTDPKFVLFKHVLCFARIMSTNCPNWGSSCPRPVRLCCLH